jgi:predicted nucleic acid-binding protein
MPAILASMPVPVLYLDTSVIGGYFDDEWKDATQELWRQMEAGRYQFLTSAVTADELSTAPERVRDLFADPFPAEALLGITVESERLATASMERHILPPRFTDDARHVAVCTVTQLEYLVSWNFKHLVNVEREKGFNAVNLLQGYRPIRIVNPLELIYGHQDQSL